jgi:hypothetical protein
MLSCENDKYKDCVCERKKQIESERDRKDKRRQFKFSHNTSNNKSFKYDFLKKASQRFG